LKWRNVIFGKINNFGILFDVDGTLYHQGPLKLAIFLWLLFAWIRHPIQTTKEIRTLIHYRRALEWLRFNQDQKMTPQSQIARTCTTTNNSVEDIKKCVVQWTEELPLHFINLCARHQLIQMIKRWHQVGIPMGIYSDYPAQAKLMALGIEHCISVNLCSTDSQVGTLKPASSGFLIAAQKMGLKPEHCIYVGDREDIDIRGAQNAGMRAVFVNKKNLNKLYQQIAQLKVEETT